MSIPLEYCQLFGPSVGPVLFACMLQAATWEEGASSSTISSIDEQFGHNSNGNGSSSNAERHPPGRSHYTAPRPGSWRLADSKLSQDQASQLPPLMLVSSKSQGLASNKELSMVRAEQPAVKKPLVGTSPCPIAFGEVFMTALLPVVMLSLLQQASDYTCSKCCNCHECTQ